MIRHVCIPAGRFDWKTYCDELDDEEWEALEYIWSIDPWGDPREDFRFRWVLSAACSIGAKMPDEAFDYLGHDEMRPLNEREKLAQQVAAEDEREAIRDVLLGRNRLE